MSDSTAPNQRANQRTYESERVCVFAKRGSLTKGARDFDRPPASCAAPPPALVACGVARVAAVGERTQVRGIEPTVRRGADGFDMIHVGCPEPAAVGLVEADATDACTPGSAREVSLP